MLRSIGVITSLLAVTSGGRLNAVPGVLSPALSGHRAVQQAKPARPRVPTSAEYRSQPTDVSHALPTAVHDRQAAMMTSGFSQASSPQEVDTRRTLSNFSPPPLPRPQWRPGANATAAAVALVACLAIGFTSPRSPVAWKRSVEVFGKKKKKGWGGGGGGGGDNEEAEEIDVDAMMEEYDTKMEKTTDILRNDLRGIRAGKATPELLSGVDVEAYDSTVNIKEVATVTATDNNNLSVLVYDEDIADKVESCLRNAGLGYGFQRAGASIRVTIPELTQDKRAEYVKLVKNSGEKTRQAIRSVRQIAMKKVKGYKKTVPEDLFRSMEAEVEKLTKRHVGNVDKIVQDKSAELEKL